MILQIHINDNTSDTTFKIDIYSISFMELKNAIPMIVGLAVTVVLVAGLMVPVISSLSTDNGENRPEYTNSGSVYYKPIGADSYTISVGIEQNDSDLTTVSISINGGSPKIIGPEWVGGSEITALFYPLLTFTQNGKMGVEGILFNGSFGNMDAEYFITCGGAGYLRMIEGEERPSYNYLFDIDSLSNRTIQITNGAVTYDFTDPIDAEYNLILSDSEVGATSVWATDNAKVYSDDPTIFFGCVGDATVQSEDPELGDMIVIDSSLLSFDFDITDAGTGASVYGEGSGSAVLEFDSSESEGLYTYSGATINDENVNGGVIVPISVGGGSGGSGSGISDTLMSLISVIPLITVVGIVLGAITILRRN